MARSRGSIEMHPARAPTRAASRARTQSYARGGEKLAKSAGNRRFSLPRASAGRATVWAGSYSDEMLTRSNAGEIAPFTESRTARYWIQDCPGGDLIRAPLDL